MEIEREREREREEREREREKEGSARLSQPHVASKRATTQLWNNFSSSLTQVYQHSVKGGIRSTRHGSGGCCDRRGREREREVISERVAEFFSKLQRPDKIRVVLNTALGPFHAFQTANVKFLSSDGNRVTAALPWVMAPYDQTVSFALASVVDYRKEWFD